MNGPYDKCEKCGEGKLTVGPRYDSYYYDGDFRECLLYSCDVCGYAIRVSCKDA